MSEIAYTRWLPRAVTAAAVAFAFFAGAAAVKPAAAAFVGVGVGIPGDYYAPLNEPARAGGSRRLGRRIFDEVRRGNT